MLKMGAGKGNMAGVWPAARVLYSAWMLLLAAAAVLSANSCRAEKAGKTQIILISVDTLRGDHLNSYGYRRETAPQLAALIRDSVYYREANLNGCWTMPSHVSMLTGTLPSRHGVNMGWKSQPGYNVTKPGRSIRFLAELLRERKVRTWKFARLPKELGFARGFDGNEETDPFMNDREFKKVTDCLSRVKEDDFFLFLHTWMVHSPYSYSCFLDKAKADAGTRDQIDRFRATDGDLGNMSKDFAALLERNRLYNRDDCVALYDGGIRHADRYVGRIVALAKRLGIYENLMLIVTSDHGEHFSEHYPDCFYNFHGRDYTEEFIKVPLIIKYPGSRLTGRRNDPVSHIDIVPTVLDHYGWEIPAFVQGRSLLRKGPEAGAVIRVAEAIHENLRERKMIRLGSMKYIVTMRKVSGKEKANWQMISKRRLFDLKSDPGETRNLAEASGFQRVRDDLERKLREIIRRSASDRFAAETTEMSEETLKQLKALGYL